jgi:hypothetical protein
MTFTVTQSQNGKGSLGCGSSQTPNGRITPSSLLDDLDLHVTLNGTVTKRWSVGSESNGEYAQVMSGPESDLGHESAVSLKSKPEPQAPASQRKYEFQNGNPDVVLRRIEFENSEVSSKKLNGIGPNILVLNKANGGARLRSVKDADPPSLPQLECKKTAECAGTESSATEVSLTIHTGEYWRELFDQFDPEGFGEILWPEFILALHSPQFRETIEPGKLQLLEEMAFVESRNSTAITFQHFLNIVSEWLHLFAYLLCC